MTRQYWLMKSEPDVYSILNLKKDKKTLWTGVRNYQARNFMMQQMKIGDEVLFYHSNAEPPGIAGVARVSAAAIPDPSQFDKKSDFFAEKATKAKPIWFCTELEYVQVFSRLLSLNGLRETPELSTMEVLKKGQRLSVQPVTEKEFLKVLEMATAAHPAARSTATSIASSFETTTLGSTPQKSRGSAAATGDT